MRLLPAYLLAGALTTSAHAADVTDTRFSDAKFETATTVFFEAKGADAAPKDVFLWVYQSRLGSILKKRDLKPEETAELQRICKRMHAMAKASDRGSFDGYGIEFANGSGDTSNLSPSRRVVFFFWDEGACAMMPSRGKVG
ncbi:MAG: hypothetical protein AAFW87_06495 [Pseudomonadota bacterium]